MVRAKNYETMSTCVKAMQKKLWPLFSGHGVHTLYMHVGQQESPRLKDIKLPVSAN